MEVEESKAALMTDNAQAPTNAIDAAGDDMCQDFEEYMELKASYKTVKRQCKALQRDPMAQSEEERARQFTCKKEMKAMIKRNDKVHPEWKGMYKQQKKN